MNKIKYLLLLLVAAVMPAMAGVNMTAVEFNSLPGGLVELRFTFDGQAPEPKVYTIETPARIALDLNGVSSKLGRKKHVLDLGNTKSVNVVEAGGRTRIIVNLQQLTPHTARVEGNELIVSVGGDGKKEYLKGGSAQLGKESKSDKISSIASIDFRRGEKGEGRLIIELTNPNIDVNTYVEGKLIKLAFSNTEMPESLRLRYDVSDFATPVQWVKAHETSTGAALLDVAASGEYDYLAYQTQNTYVLTVKPLSKSEIEAKKREFAYVGDKLSLNFQDIEVRSVLQLIADFTDLNLVASDTVTGKITLRLQNVPWDQALDLILKTKGLDKRQDGNVLMVAPAAEIAEREQQEIATNKQREELAPLQTEFIRVRYAEAADIFNLLQGESGDDDGGAESSGSLLSARATVVVDARTNSLLITETAQKLEEIRHLINLIDVPVRQVLIEARIVVAASQAAEKLGIEWGASSYNQTNGGFTSMEGSSESLTEYGNALRNGGTFESSPIIDLGVDDLNASKIALGFFKNNKFLNLELSAIETAGQGEVVSQPKIITGDKQNAVIKSGTEIAYQETAPNGGTTTAFKDAALILDVTPSITPDDRIIMELMITQDSIGEETSNGVPTINTTELNTQVLVNNGETIVLGGIFKTEDLRSETKTPFLGDIPYLGRLFRKTSVRSEKTEILIFITPRILADNLVD